MNASDGPELLDWLRHQPLLHHDTKTGYTLIHAGLPPQWDLDTARRCANKVSKVLRMIGPDIMPNKHRNSAPLREEATEELIHQLYKALGYGVKL